MYCNDGDVAPFGVKALSLASSVLEILDGDFDPGDLTTLLKQILLSWHEAESFNIITISE